MDFGANSREQLTSYNPDSLLPRTLEDSSAQQPIAIWNSARGVWEKLIPNLLCAHLGLFSEVWPTSGMMRDGLVFGLPMLAHRITGLGFSSSVSDENLLRSPKASEGQGGALGEAEALKRGNTVAVRDPIMDLVAGQGLKVSRVSDNLLPTPVVNDMGAGKTVDGWDEWTAKTKAKHQNGNGHGPSLNIEMLRLQDQADIQLLMTPMAQEGIKAPAQQTSEVKGKTGQVWLSNQAKDMELAWGKFEPAIRRWEAVLGRPAPAPTKPDGKDGAHRLSSAFTEWMMGLPEGWITGVGLTRNEELKACGNGVVPQQAELALRMLLDGIDLEPTRGGQVMLPTPTVSDTFTSNLKSSQQKEGSMHSVTLPQAVERLIPRDNLEVKLEVDGPKTN